MFHLFEKINKGNIYFIAEMSANHAGRLENALEIVHQAAQIGVDCLKIQTYTADTITINCDNPCFNIEGGLWDGYKLYDLYNDAETPWEWQKVIKAECDLCGIDFLSTPFDCTAVDFLSNLGCEAFKIASFELVDIPLIEYAARFGKPMLISCGMGSDEEIQEALEACYRVGNHQIVLLKCCSEYPAKWENMHLTNIREMKKRYSVPIGLSDHSMGSLGAVVGATLGAKVIEKHICLSRTQNTADSAFSMEINEFSQMMIDVKNACSAIGTEYFGPTEGEKNNYRFRRSLFAVDDIKAGDIFTSENVRSIRPSDGIKPKYLYSILGKTALVDIKKGTPISLDFFNNDNG